MPISKAALALLMWSVAWAAMSADDPGSLDEDFLSYLAELEGDDDDWTIVEPAPAAAKPASQPATQTTIRTPPKTPPKTTTPPPAKPATPDDGSKR